MSATLLNHLRIWRDQLRLTCIRSVECHVASLRAIDTEWLRGVFDSETASSDWPVMAHELAKLGITESAGGVNPGDRRALFYLVRALRPAAVLEIGTHIGASTVHIAAALRANAAGPFCLTSVDVADVNDARTRPWETFGSALSPREMIARLGMREQVEFVTRPSLEFLGTTDRGFDLIFLDGDHSAATVYQELPAALRRLTTDGLILLHDYFPSAHPLWSDGQVIAGPWLAAERLRREGVGVEILPLGALPWPTKQGSYVTSLAIVTRA